MDGRNIIQACFKGKIVNNDLETPKFPKLKKFRKITVYTKQTSLFHKNKYYIAWLEPKESIPFIWGFVSIFDNNWTKPEPITHSQIMSEF